MQSETCYVVLVTASDDAEAQKIAHALLEKRLAACVNRLPGVTSTYWWQGKIESATEVLLVIKTRQGLLEALIAAVKQAHSYTVPEVVALPIEGGNADYLAWLVAEATGDRRS